MRDPWARHREILHQGLLASLEGNASGSGQLVHEQIEASDPAEYEPAALVCLAAAQAVGKPVESALTGAVALALLSQMAIVFTSLDNSGGAPSLSTAWGMPRSLNAGDAMFALAQECILSGSEELTAEERLAATGLLDRGGRGLMDFLNANRDSAASIVMAQRALFPTAMALGALFGGADAATRDRLEGLGVAWSTMPEDQLSRVLASDPAGWLATTA